MSLPGFAAEASLAGSRSPYQAAAEPEGPAAGGEVVPQLFYIAVGPGRCAVGEYANGACWFYGIVSC